MEDGIMTANQIEIALAQHLDYRHNLIVPNVSWGWGLREEADLVVARKSGYADEIEIKVTASDIKADLKKMNHREGFRPSVFSRLWFAVPEILSDNPNIPAHAGIYAVDLSRGKYRAVRVHRQAKMNPHREKLTDRQLKKLMELGCMRIWTLKTKLIGLK